jgi:internalin A
MAEIGEKAGRAGTYWLNGFAFYDDKTKSRALVEQSRSKDWSGQIAVSCFGGEAAELLARVLRLLDDRTERFGTKPTSRSSSLDRTHEEARHRMPESSGGGPAEALEPVFEPTTEREFYVSYAWGDATPEGLQREKVVDDFCAAAEACGVKITRDKKAMQRGDEIPKFMARLIQAERVLVILSDKYLRSPYCMEELLGVWRECAECGDKFRERTKFYVFPSANIFSESGIDAYAAHWASEATALEQKIAGRLRLTSEKRFGLMRRYHRYADKTEEVLEHIRGILHTSNLDDFLAYALRDISD